MSDDQEHEPWRLQWARHDLKAGARQPAPHEQAELVDHLREYAAAFGYDAVSQAVERAVGARRTGKPKSRRIAVRNQARLAFYDHAVAREPGLSVEQVALTLSEDADLGGNAAERIKNDLYALLKARNEDRA